MERLSDYKLLIGMIMDKKWWGWQRSGQGWGEWVVRAVNSLWMNKLSARLTLLKLYGWKVVQVYVCEEESQTCMDASWTTLRVSAFINSYRLVGLFVEYVLVVAYLPYELRSACHVKLFKVRELNMNAATHEVLVCLLLFVVCTWNCGLRGLN